MQLGRPGAAVLRQLPIDMSRSPGRQQRLREPTGLPPGSPSGPAELCCSPPLNANSSTSPTGCSYTTSPKRFRSAKNAAPQFFFFSSYPPQPCCCCCCCCSLRSQTVFNKTNVNHQLQCDIMRLTAVNLEELQHFAFYLRFLCGF